MGSGTQSVHILRSFLRASVLAAFVLLFTLGGLIRPTVAQEGDSQAGLVIQFSDGSIHTACVDLGPEGQATGEEVLRSSGLNALIDYTSGFGGGTVCKIAEEGCDFPAEPCFCQCTMKPGDPCVYWIYFHLLDGQWLYSNQGLNNRIVKAGDVEGWVWGAGSAGIGMQPPLITFDQICGAASRSALPTAEPATLSPTAPSPLEDVAVPDEPVVSPQLSATATNTVTPAAMPSTMSALELASTASSTSTPEAIVSRPEDESVATPTIETSPPTASIQPGENGLQDNTGYIVFVVLVVVLVGGLIYTQTR